MANLCTLDRSVFVVVVVLSLMGIAAQYSSANGSLAPWALKQSAYLAVSLVAFAGVFFWGCVRSSVYVLYVISFLSLLFVAVAGDARMGAARWISFGFFQFQPSELAKLTTVLALARCVQDLNLSKYSPLRFFVIPLALVAAPAALVLVQPHLGNSVLIFLVGLSVIFVAGFSVKVVCLALSLTIPCMPLAWMFILRPYQKVRVISFPHPEKDPLGAGYNVLQSEIAVGSGGVWGKGFLQGSQAHLGFLPEKHTDFVFTIISEEFGFVGCIVALSLYVLLFLRLYRMFYGSEDKFVRLSILGITLMLCYQSLMNIFMTLGLMPVVGVPLPFISHGGSSLLVSMISVGVACNMWGVTKMNCK